MKRPTVIALIVALTICVNVTVVSASTFSARIYPDRIHVAVSSNLTQNITSLFERETVLSGDSLADASKKLESSIRTKSPSAYVKDATIRCTFSNSSIEASLEFDVFAVVIKHEEVVTANLTWRAFNIVDDIVVGNLSCNTVGRSYLLKAIPRYENMNETRFYENRTLPATAYRARDIVGNVTMLQFKALGIPLSKWERTYDIAKAETRYVLRAGRIVDLAAKRELNTSTTEFGVWVDLSSEISVSGYAHVGGETIVSETRIGLLPLLMLGSILAPLTIVIAAHVIEMRKRPRVEGKRRWRSSFQITGASRDTTCLCRHIQTSV